MRNDNNIIFGKRRKLYSKYALRENQSRPKNLPYIMDESRDTYRCNRVKNAINNTKDPVESTVHALIGSK